MTDFEIFALTMPVVGAVFVVCLVLIVMRFNRHDPAADPADAPRADLKQAAE